MCDSVYLRIYDLGMFRGVVLGMALGRCNMILNLPEPYWGECSCEVAILSCFCALIGAKESPDVRIRVPWFGLDGLMGRDG